MKAVTVSMCFICKFVFTLHVCNSAFSFSVLSKSRWRGWAELQWRGRKAKKDELISFHPHWHQPIVAEVNSWKINDSPDTEFITRKVTLPQTLLLFELSGQALLLFFCSLSERNGSHQFCDWIQKIEGQNHHLCIYRVVAVRSWSKTSSKNKKTENFVKLINVVLKQYLIQRSHFAAFSMEGSCNKW